MHVGIVGMRVEEVGLVDLAAVAVLDDQPIDHRRVALHQHPAAQAVVEYRRDQTVLTRRRRLLLDHRGQRHDLVGREVCGFWCAGVAVDRTEPPRHHFDNRLSAQRLVQIVGVGEKEALEVLCFGEELFHVGDSLALRQEVLARDQLGLGHDIGDLEPVQALRHCDRVVPYASARQYLESLPSRHGPFEVILPRHQSGLGPQQPNQYEQPP